MYTTARIATSATSVKTLSGSWLRDKTDRREGKILSDKVFQGVVRIEVVLGPGGQELKSASSFGARLSDASRPGKYEFKE
jgi:hypothetical protein